MSHTRTHDDLDGVLHNNVGEILSIRPLTFETLQALCGHTTLNIAKATESERWKLWKRCLSFPYCFTTWYMSEEDSGRMMTMRSGPAPPPFLSIHLLPDAWRDWGARSIRHHQVTGKSLLLTSYIFCGRSWCMTGSVSSTLIPTSMNIRQIRTVKKSKPTCGYEGIAKALHHLSRRMSVEALFALVDHNYPPFDSR